MVLFIGAARRFLIGQGCCSERTGAGKVRSGWLCRSKIDDHNVIFPPHNVAVRTSDRLHGTNSNFPSVDDRISGAAHLDYLVRSFFADWRGAISGTFGVLLVWRQALDPERASRP
jgi:hypothetical protein